MVMPQSNNEHSGEAKLNQSPEGNLNGFHDGINVFQCGMARKVPWHRPIDTGKDRQWKHEYVDPQQSPPHTGRVFHVGAREFLGNEHDGRMGHDDPIDDNVRHESKVEIGGHEGIDKASYRLFGEGQRDEDEKGRIKFESRMYACRRL